MGFEKNSLGDFDICHLYPFKNLIFQNVLFICDSLNAVKYNIMSRIMKWYSGVSGFGNHPSLSFETWLCLLLLPKFSKLQFSHL